MKTDLVEEANTEPADDPQGRSGWFGIQDASKGS